MISVDTNILVRILTGDDDFQCRKAMNLFENNEIFITDTVILETEWVLRYAYAFSRIDINRALLHLCGLPQVNLAHPQHIAKALTWHQDGLDFADGLHLAGSGAQDSFASFDQALIKISAQLGAMPKVFAP
ncbi:MAG: type II toxin-antitoxin system VapC family toxin [Mariprofundaceae bacterium]|nr:type II toxin-antitoxin system VapC family toxin [Mariprofundaceae bacterium]